MAVTYQWVSPKDEEAFNKIDSFLEEEEMDLRTGVTDDDRWGKCSEALLAEEDAKLIGVCIINTEPPARRPELDLVFVALLRRRSGVGFELTTKGMQRLIEKCDAEAKIFCNPTNEKARQMLKKLPEEWYNRLSMPPDLNKVPDRNTFKQSGG